MTILITGAARGIGRGLRDAYLAQGQEVIGTCRGPAPDHGAWLSLDVRDPAAHREMALALGGQPLSLLVCNAGIYPDKGQRLGDGFAATDWADAFAVNVTGVFLTVQALLPNLRAARGRIAIIASAMGSDTRAPGGSYIYRASKAAALNLGRNLATDLKPDGIAVGIYHPGWVRTDMGGAAAEIDLETATAGLIARFEELAPDTTGRFLAYDGTPVPF
ncbi:SDR family NAD(P)-dependent oxidoreductase [Halodurantibacterium flavum]|uniref:SDR family NAD(P)-dependent oxidoreductase n=1 Tax=Halodurantibacterium flavum TaxID=1382802 RepID=A0ABW4S6R1_9RHOB